MDAIVKKVNETVVITIKTRVIRGKGPGARKRRKEWRTPDVRRYLKEKHPEYNIGTALQGAYVNNFETTLMEGTWIFALASTTKKGEPKPPASEPKTQKAPPPPATPIKEVATPTTQKKMVKKVRRVMRPKQGE